MEFNKTKIVSFLINFLLVTPNFAFTSHFSHLHPFFAKFFPIVTTSLGKIQGKIGFSLRTGKIFYQFLSVPYAKPPVGKLLFEPPVPITKPWTGVKQCVKYPPKCLQFEALGLQNVQGKENCLFLNVFVSTPRNKFFLNHTRPVLVYIHGGGFLSSGARTYRPGFFMDQDDIVLVTMNYRLGPYGFLNLAEPNNYNDSNVHLPRGNMGLKDQLVVLEWVQKNIQQFGGDPRKVTIFGQSAGAASVHFHMIAPRSRGLFQKAFTFSGTALSPWAIFKDSGNISRKFVRSLGCPLGNATETMECLHNADAKKMVRLQRVLPDPLHENDLLGPSLEVVKLNDTFLEEYPIDLIRKGEYPKIPWILGVNSGEGIIVSSRLSTIRDSAKKLEKIWPSKVAFFGSIPTSQVTQTIADKVRNFYFGPNNISSLDTETFVQAITKLSSDALFYRGTHQAAIENARHGAPTYLFYFNYTSSLIPSIFSVSSAVTPRDWLPGKFKVSLSLAREFLVETIYGSNKSSRRFGTSHGEDLFQVWNMERLFGYFSFGDKGFSDALIKTMVQFARNDDKKSELEFRGTFWKPLSDSDIINGGKCLGLPTMHMNNSKKPNMIMEPYAESLKFWAVYDN